MNCISSHFQSFLFSAFFRTLILPFSLECWSNIQPTSHISENAFVGSFGPGCPTFHPFDLQNASYNKSFKSNQCSNITGVIPNVCIFDGKGSCKITILKHLDVVESIEKPSPQLWCFTASKSSTLRLAF